VSTSLLTGFRFRWNLTSHRLPLLTADARDPARFALKIGAFPPDRAVVDVTRTRVDGLDAPVGSTPALHLAEPLGQVARTTHRVRLPAGSVGHPLLQGFAFDRVDNPAGWHFGRLAISLGEVHDDGRGPCFDVHASVRPSESPEHIPFGNKPWQYDQDAACTVVVHWVLVPSPTEPEAHAWSGTVPLAVEADLHAPIELPPEHAVGLRGFALDMTTPDRARRTSRMLRYLTGRYVRELGVGIEPGEPATAWATGSNLPRGHLLYKVMALVSVPVLWALCVVNGWSPLGVIAFGPAAAMTYLLVFWPGGTFRFPVTPWKLEASLDVLAVPLPADATAHAEIAHGLLDAPDPPHEVALEYEAVGKT